jgi:fatty-acyl-CoA synthase
MRSLMQETPLTTQHMLWRLERLFSRKEAVTRVDGGVVRLTYGEMARRVRRAAAALARLGVKPGDVVATFSWTNARHMELYYAVPCMGAVLHTLNLRLHPTQLLHVIADGGARVICVDRSLLPALEKLAGKLPGGTRVVLLDAGPVPESPLGELLSYEELLAAERDGFAWPQLDERAPAAMCHTSGTTGMPKGVVYSHRSQFLHAMALLQTSVISLAEADRVLVVVPFFHANAWGLPYGAAMSGATLILPDRWMGDAAVLHDLIVQERATLLCGVPTVWINLLNHLEAKDARAEGVRMVLCGGSAVPRALVDGLQRRGLPLLHAWGMTETSPIGTVCHTRSWHPPESALDVRLTQGPPVPGVELRIADVATGEELPWDGRAIGEIQVRGPWVASGYHGGADPDRTTKDGWFKTGDVATVDEDGYVRIVDRTKDVIKSGGEWISSVALENALMGHPGVLEAAVIGLPHARWQERPVAYVTTRGQPAPTCEELLEYLAERVASWWLPDEIRFVPEVPKTSVGKFDKKRLRAEAVPLAT